MQSIHATYIEGVFKPIDPVALPEGSEVELQIVVPQANSSTNPRGERSLPTIEDQLSRIARQLPSQEWDSLPADLSESLDHYLYGTERG